MPTCVLAQSPQAFAIPVSGQFDLREPAKYLEPLACLGAIANELAKQAYGTKCQIQALAIVEEVKTQWWLVLGLRSPQPMQNVKSYLRARVPLDLERMTTLTPCSAAWAGETPARPRSYWRRCRRRRDCSSTAACSRCAGMWRE